ncbi:hypothetical protein AOQ73_18205 [Bradyrhizobium pachyrhizi]|uniref:hypothetical protein n=1 Tax=Bradyrhizobium pachyrhizi TaxID=280333 RepID=UPI0007053C9A|nr:hypothetical protein [Bradyrhizobium pachyrhizi]KRQ01288.1 hypothetical protein AOQ73_18205 [Bradyrhizobium pachyrhizi]
MAPLDDPILQLTALKIELRQTEGLRDDTLKASDDPTAQAPRQHYLANAAAFERRAATIRAEIADLEAQLRLSRGR